jgi:hypothetical protein
MTNAHIKPFVQLPRNNLFHAIFEARGRLQKFNILYIELKIHIQPI